jgi:hypothetical protein
MKKIKIVTILLSITFGSIYLFSQVTKLKANKQPAFKFKNGDIVFQTGNSRQCKAVKLATHSDLTHCGIYLTNEKGEGYIYEAVQPVKRTSVEEFIAHGENGDFHVARLKNTEINDSLQKIMLKTATKYIGKNYDIYFGWNDNEIYCSEYVWKIYKNALSIELCNPKKMKDFDLSHPSVKAIMAERYGSNLPLEELMVAPSDIYNSPKVDLIR